MARSGRSIPTLGASSCGRFVKVAALALTIRTQAALGPTGQISAGIGSFSLGLSTSHLIARSPPLVGSVQGRGAPPRRSSPPLLATQSGLRFQVFGFARWGSID